MFGEITTAMLPPPAVDQAYVEVSALEAGNITLPIDKLVADTEPEIMSCPSLICAAALQDGTAAESLEKGGVSPGEVNAVIVSHLHWDHIGDHTPFTKATFLVGEGCRALLENGYRENSDGLFSSTAIPAERARFLSKSDLSTSVGPYPQVLDFFGDGSLHIVDAPGHFTGHINALARTSADGSWILLGGDSAHDWRIVTGEKAFACVVDEATGRTRCMMHADKDAAEENLRRVQALLRAPKVQVLIAHDVPWYEANKGGPAFLPGVIPPAY